MNYCETFCAIRNRLFNQKKCKKCDKLFDYIFHDKDLIESVLLNSFFGKKKIKERLKNIDDKQVEILSNRIVKYYKINEFF